jgi:hypothetical protein
LLGNTSEQVWRSYPFVSFERLQGIDRVSDVVLASSRPVSPIRCRTSPRFGAPVIARTQRRLPD